MSTSKNETKEVPNIMILAADNTPYVMSQYSPMKQLVSRGVLAKPIGDLKEAIFRMMTEDTLTSMAKLDDEND